MSLKYNFIKVFKSSSDIIDTEVVMNDTTYMWTQYIETKSPVIIYKQEELESLSYAVAFASDPEFWLDAFPSLKQAKLFCKQYELPIKKVITK